MTAKIWIALALMALGLAACGTGPGLTGNTTGGIITWNPENQANARGYAAEHCGNYGKVAELQPIYARPVCPFIHCSYNNIQEAPWGDSTLLPVPPLDIGYRCGMDPFRKWARLPDNISLPPSLTRRRGAHGPDSTLNSALFRG